MVYYTYIYNYMYVYMYFSGFYLYVTMYLRLGQILHHRMHFSVLFVHVVRSAPLGGAIHIDYAGQTR